MPTRASKGKGRSDDEGVGSALRAVEQAIGDELMPKKNKHAQALSRLGASKGGRARAASLSSAKRKAIAKKAATARWGSPPGAPTK